MNGRVAGKVALVSGAARGQGRAHAERLAEEGADLILFDACAPIDSQGNPPATESDLAETAALAEKFGRRVLTRVVDARDGAAVDQLVADGVAELGGLDIAIVNHGITGIPGKVHETPVEVWRDVIANNLTSVWRVGKASIGAMLAGGKGGSVTFTASAAAIRAVENMNAYVAAKHGILGMTQALAQEYAAAWVRVNCVLPTAVSTPMIHNDNTYAIFRPELEHPTSEDVMEPFRGQNLLPIPWVEPLDVANAALFLSSEEARYVTGVAFPVDGGNVIRLPH
jgi:(+)-trans-carveol dehydrogenase